MTCSMKRRRLLGLIALSGMSCATRVLAHGVSLEFHHPLASNAPLHKDFFLHWTQKVESEAGGRIRFHIHPASTLGGAAEELYGKARDGAADVVWAPVLPAVNHLPALAVFTMPCMVRSATGASRALSEYARMNDLSDRDFDGTRVIAAHVGDPAQLHWVKSPESTDVTGRRIAVTSKADGMVLSALGAKTIELAPPRMAAALEAGDAEGVALPWSQLEAMGMDKIARAHTDFGVGQRGLSASVYVFALSAGSHRSLPDDLKVVIANNSGTDTTALIGRVFDRAAERERRAAQDRGDVIRVLSAEDRRRWEDAAGASNEAQLKPLANAGVKTKVLLDSAREQLGAYDKAPV